MRSALFLPLITAALAVSAGGCVFPHRSTSLSPVQDDRASTMGAPDDVWQVTIVEGHIRPRKSGDLAWDEGDGLPDVFVRFIRDGEVLLETETIEDSLTPRWDASLDRNLRLGPRTPIRIEVWDRDTVGSDPVGIYDRRGLPDMAVEGADARIMLEGGSWLTIRRSRPQAHRGVGIEDYEIHPDRLRVVAVHPYSPAARAGIAAGDSIVAIGDRRVADLSDGQAASALSMAAGRHESITFERNGREQTVELDRGFVWLTR